MKYTGQLFLFRYLHNGVKEKFVLKHPLYMPLREAKTISDGVFLAGLSHPEEEIQFVSLEPYYA